MTEHTPTDDLRCERARLLLSRALDGAATPEQQAELDAHLPGCAECRAAAAADRAVRTRLAEPASVPAGFADRVLAAATRRMREVRAQNRFLMLGAAAAAVLAVLTLFLQRGPATDGAETVALRDGRARAGTALITSLAADRVPAAAAEESPR